LVSSCAPFREQALRPVFKQFSDVLAVGCPLLDRPEKVFVTPQIRNLHSTPYLLVVIDFARLFRFSRPGVCVFFSLRFGAER